MSVQAVGPAPVAEHYRSHLAPVYLWMAGGFKAAVAKGEAEVAELCPDFAAGSTAVDLGAGFGMHAIPLARRGCTVTAVDTSALLLDELRCRAGGLPVTTVESDLASYLRGLQSRVDLVLCMGDTLAHLPSFAAVEELSCLIARSLRPGGRFVATFRDYGAPLDGPARFIPVRSDAGRILTCFLEYSAGHVTVHDLLHERNGLARETRVSAYRKLRLTAGGVAEALRAAGFSVRVEPGGAGMVRMVGVPD